MGVSWKGFAWACGLGFVLMCAGKPTKGAIGAKGSPDGVRNVPSASSYVQNGLIALWDGIENVGWGTHDAQATVWKDLVGNRLATLTAHGAFSNNALVCDGVGYAANDGKCFSRSEVQCVEVVFDYHQAGIVCVLANAGSTSADGGIRVSVSSAAIQAMNVGSVGAGLKNTIDISSPYGLYSASFNYSSTDLIRAYLNGDERTVRYAFGSSAADTVCFGGRAQNADRPFGGKIYCIRVYRRALTDGEVKQNYQIDKERFGL